MNIYKTIKLSFSFFLLIGITASGQNINWENAPLNPTAIYHTKNHFNINGPIKTYYKTKFSGKLFYLDFNEHGYLTKKLTSSSGGTFKIVTYYTYSSIGVLSNIKQVYLDSKGNPTDNPYEYSISYNQNGLISAKIKLSDGSKTVYSYNENNQLISVIYPSTKSSIVKKTNYEYNNEDQIILENEYNYGNIYNYKFEYIKKDSNTLELSLYTYKNDTLAKREYPYAIASIDRQSSIGIYKNPERYLYDNNGNETYKRGVMKVNFDQYNNLRSEFSNITKIEFTNVEISYYDNITSKITEAKETVNNCISGNCTNGYGEFKETNGVVSKGFFVNGNLQGYASQQFTNGDNFSGKFIDGQKNGYGIYYWKASKQQYYGHWKNNVIDGYGYIVEDGKTFQGGIYTNGKLTKDLLVDFKNKKLTGGNCLGNCLDGYGTIQYNNGNGYTGFFLNGSPYKAGNFRWKLAKSSFVGDFNTRGEIYDFGMYIEEASIYVGDITNGQLTGKGFKTDRKTFAETYGEFNRGKLVLDYSNPNTKITNTTVNISKPTEVCLSGNCVDGYGKQKTKDASTSTGFFKNSSPNGYGKEVYDNGSGTYEGTFKNSLRDGYGTYTWHKTGQYYIGQWKDGKQHGYGYFKEGTNVFQAGYYENGKQIRNLLTENYKNKVAVGNCIGNCVDGFGFYQYSNNDKYVGFFSNGKKSYVGAYTWVSGNAFIGEYLNGVSTGQGSEFYKSNGSYYRGTFLNGKRHGLGAYFDKYNKLTSKGIWENGTLKTKM